MKDEKIKDIAKIVYEVVNQMDEDEEELFETCCCSVSEDELDFVEHINPYLPYNKRDFIKFIFNYGSSRFDYVVYSEDQVDDMGEAVSQILENHFGGYFAVRFEKGCIAIAAPQYIRDAKQSFSKVLRIIPDVFKEVSGPQSTVMIIDCEKEWLLAKYLGIGEEEWLL